MAQSPKTGYPPASLYPVAYNVRPGDLDRDTNLDVPETQFFLSQPRVRPPEWRECNEIEASLGSCVARYLDDNDCPKVDSLGERLWGTGNIGDFLGDRTVNVSFAYHALLTPSFVAMLQRDVLSKRHLWRIVIRIAPDREYAVAIYPDALSIGAVFCDDLDASITAWQLEMRDWHEREYGAYERQFQSIGQRLPAVRQRLFKASFAIAGLFDNWDGDATDHSLWLAYYATDYEDVSVKEEIASEGHWLLVDEKGLLRSSSFETDEWLSSDDPKPAPSRRRLRLRQFVLPAASEHHLTIRIRSKRKRATIHLTEDRLIRDADLKRRFAR